MKRIVAVFITAIVVVSIAEARTYDATHLPYSDAPDDLPTAVALSVLTDEGVVRGHADGRFLPGTSLNRAEFVAIVLRLLPLPLPQPAEDCFVDVDHREWYAPSVCRAKELHIVRGNALPDVLADQWPFEPSRDVRYEEALKVLFELYGVPATRTGKEWYERYTHTADDLDLALPGLRPGRAITRGETVQLVAGFLAHSRGELSDLRMAQEEGRAGQSAQSAYGADSSDPSPSDSSSAAPAERCCLDARETDPDADVSVESDFLQLGTTGPVMASAQVFSNTEPLSVTEIQITLAATASSIQSFRIFDHDGVLLGTAHLDTAVRYTLDVTTGRVSIPMREDYSFYVRPILRSFPDGGVSGETARIASFTVIGDGEWSNRTYTKGTNETFNAFQTARSAIASVGNAGDESDVLVSGNDVPIGSFRFSGSKGDGAASLRVTDFVIQVESFGGIGLGNVRLTADGTSDRHACATASGLVTCSAIPAQFGDFEDQPRTITLLGDVTVSSGAQRAGLRLTLNQAGSVGSAGTVTWTDGDTSFTWVPGGSPVARGTYYSY